MEEIFIYDEPGNCRYNELENEEELSMKIAALDIGGTFIKFALIDDVEWKILSWGEEETCAYLGGKAVMDKVISILSKLGDFDRIGISTAGQVNQQTGTILYATDNIPNYTGTPVKELIQTQFSVPVAIDNDVKCAGLCEALIGAGKGFGNVLCVTYGTGIGGAMIQNGRVLRGSVGSAGEVGHVITHAEGNQCTCGAKGCYETYASTAVLIQMVEKRTGEKLNGKEIFQRIDQAQIKDIIDEWIKEVSYGLRSLVYVFNPDCIVLGGGIMQQAYVVESLKKTVRQNVMESVKNVELRAAKMGNYAGAIGAAMLAAEVADE